MRDFKIHIDQAVAEGQLLASSAENIERLLAGASSPIPGLAVEILIATGEWEELDDRFYRTLAFGTGGLRGRSIGKIVTKAERGEPTKLGCPEHACVGTNAMNGYNISRATQGLAVYLREFFEKEGREGKPKLAIAYDTRHFSPEFAELAAKVASELGCDVAVFKKPRSTPELSFAVRHIGANAGIVLTASHNPPHDNGFKCYFADGAQVVEPHASAIIAKVNAIESDSYHALPADEQGRIESLGKEIDEAYMARLETLVLDREMVRAQKDLRIVYTPIHGTGGEIIVPMLKRLGFKYHTVPEQDVMDGRFPTVKSPNPENAEALSMGLEVAKKEHADVLMATDPDCDRLGAAIRNVAGEMELITGNQIGSMIAYYRVKKLIEQRVITPENAGRAVIIKTFVTSDLQKAIAEKAGMRCVETLTGFKYIGEKLGKYEDALPPEVRADYRDSSEEETRAARLNGSSYYVFGGEESYGYSGADFVRDKDGNGAAVMFAEVAAYAKSRGLTLDGLLDEIYREYGFYYEKNGALTFEGAEGAEKIKRLIESYATNQPAEAAGAKVTAVKDFARETFHDVEGDVIPTEKMMIFELSDGRRVAVRPSGTEPKIKFYMFAHRSPAAGSTLSEAELPEIKQAVKASIEELWEWVQQDAAARVAA